MRLGADPEIFLVNGKGKYISAIGKIGGDKYNPLQVRGLRKGFTLQEDNVALEFGIPPSASADEFVKNIETVMRAGQKKIGGLSFSGLSCTVFPADQMRHPKAHVFGCEPDYDAWTGEENVKPKPPHVYMRSAGGHIHVETKKDKLLTTKYMDLFLAVPSMLMDITGTERRQLYGKKGAFRPKPYGLEYRTLSNFWIVPKGTSEQRDKLCRWVWRNTERALASDILIDNLREPITEAVDNGNVEVAKMLVKEFNLEVLHAV